MAKYVEACGATSSNRGVVATAGINKAAQIGKFKHLFFADSDFKFDSVSAFKDVEEWNTGVKNQELIYLGEGESTDASTEESFAERPELKLKALQTEAIKSFTYELGICACNTAELFKLKGQSGTLFIQTSTDLGLAVYTDDKKIKGFDCTIDNVNVSIPSTDAPWEITTLTITLNNFNSEVRSPARPNLDFLFSDVDQVNGAEADVSNVSSNGSALSATLSVTKDCTTEKLTGLAAGDLKATDADGNELTIASYDNSTGAIEITTALTKVYLTTKGIVEVDNLLWYMDAITISV